MWTSGDRFMFPTHCCVGNIDVVWSKILFSSFWTKRIHTLLPTDFKWAKASAFDSSLPNTVCVLYSNCIFPFTSRVLMASPCKKIAVAILLCCRTAFLFQNPSFFSICDSLPRALNFVVLNSYKVPFDTSLAWLCNFSHQEDVCNWAEELIPTQFLLIYYLSSQVLLQTFITLANARLQYDTDKRLFFRSNSTCWNNHTWITPSSNTI